ncbi:MAG: 3-deoxy-7-phosphoheptulonate synthase [Planctomycetota bacterium]
MLVVMDAGVTPDQIRAVVGKIEGLGMQAHEIPGSSRVAIGITGNPGALDPRDFLVMAGVKDAIPVSKPYKLVSRETKPECSVVEVGGVRVGGGELVVIGGPCSVESEAQILEPARYVKSAGGSMLRGGAFKPRSSPYSFQGLGEEGLKLLAAAREETGLPIVTEALDERSLELVVQYADCIQIGARNMQNFTLLREAGRSGMPVLLKRGMSATVQELLMSAEYILSEGNRSVILCERGVRTFADHSRNTLDVAAVPVVKRLSHLPMIVDPSHAAGVRYLVAPLALAGLASGADGIIVETHRRPDEALSDAAQALTPEAFRELLGQLRALDRTLREARAAEPALLGGAA